MENYAPGSYTFKITGSDGALSAETTFTLTLQNPCPTSPLQLSNETPFTDQTVYRNIDEVINWTTPEIVTPSTAVDCGPISIEFSKSDGSALDEAIFSDHRLEPTNTFTILKATSLPEFKTYELIYRAYYSDYPEV